MMAANNPWSAWLGGVRSGGRANTRQVAMNRLDRPFRPGNAMVLNHKTGERWERRGGSWFKVADHWPEKHAASGSPADEASPSPRAPAQAKEPAGDPGADQGEEAA